MKTNDASGWHCGQASWPSQSAAIQCLREQVFVQEQGIDSSLEWDGKDGQCRHYGAWLADGSLIATARISPEGKLGRMAVSQPYRGRGVGASLVRSIIDNEARLGIQALFLHAQQSAQGFYERLGFSCYGEIFQEAGIAHQAMRLTLTRP